MRIHAQYTDDQPSASFTASLETQLHVLGKFRQIAAARVQLEHNASPAFRAVLHLLTPMPVFTSEAVDHTLRDALEKVVREMETKVKDRGANRSPQARRNLQEPPALRSGTKPAARR